MERRSDSNKDRGPLTGAVVASTILSALAIATSPVSPAWLRIPMGWINAHSGWLSLLWIGLAVAWLGLLIATVRAAGRKGWWLLLFAPFVLQGLLLYLLIIVACIFGSCI